MRYIFLFMFLTMVFNKAYAGDYDKVIVPINLDKLQDSTIRKEVLSITEGNTRDYLHEYKTKHYENMMVTEYKSNGWSFYIHFPNKIITREKGRFETYLEPHDILVESIRYFHVKYMLRFQNQALSNINNEISAYFGKQPIVCTARSYISHNRLRNYLCLAIENDGKILEYILVLENSGFYQCVRFKK